MNSKVVLVLYSRIQLIFFCTYNHFFVMTKLRVLQNARAKSLTSTRHKQMFSMKPFGRVNSEEKISIKFLSLYTFEPT